MFVCILMVGYNHSMEWTWNPYGMDMEWTWNPYEPVHMESIWNGDGIHMEWIIPYGFHSGYGMRKWLGPQPKSFHMDSMEWTWNPYGLTQGG